ncbi:MAG: hypothetical protein HUK19_01050 [Fibrobacter sp.]|nr:hypothetical protein [Fibrobacter sp.]
MKPSKYFTNRFKYFFKRFSSNESLFNWFAEKAGGESGAFDFPNVLKDNPKTLIFLPRDMEHSSSFMRAMPESFFRGNLVVAHESLHALVSAKRAKAVYYSDQECRYEEPVFVEIEQKIKEYAPQVVIYLGEAFLPRLYLAKVSGAPCRIGFCTESCYPFLNLSLHPDKSSEAVLLSQYYGVK